ncbi:MAG: outer membrane lipoprotein-sorting protein [Myxococcota bacterium]
MRYPTALGLVAALAGLSSAVPSWSQSHAQSAGTQTDRIVNEAFDRRYSCAITGVVEIFTRKGSMEAMKRRLHVAAKFVGGRLHTYAVFQEPEYIRGMSFLGVESEDPRLSEQQFVYLPSLRKIRRVSGSQATDSFLGTDLSYHDFQRQRADRYRSVSLREVVEGEERAIRARVEPLFDAPYSAIEYVIAASDRAILHTDYFKRGSAKPYKRMSMPRARIVSDERCSVPTLVLVEDGQRGTRTQLMISELRTNARLDDALFTTSALETRRGVPGIVDRR